MSFYRFLSYLGTTDLKEPIVTCSFSHGSLSMLGTIRPLLHHMSHFVPLPTVHPFLGLFMWVWDFLSVMSGKPKVEEATAPEELGEGP